MSNPLVVEVYYDYLCPYVYAGAFWARDVKTALGDDIEFVWRSFPLEQVNSPEGPEWKLWEQPDDYVSRGLNAFRGAEAAKLQGPDHFANFHFALLEARHVDDKNIGRKDVVIETAGKAGLDVDAFTKALDDRSLMANIGKDYENGTERTRCIRHTDVRVPRWRIGVHEDASQGVRTKTRSRSGTTS